MTKNKLLRAVQSRTARAAIGASAMRGRGNKGAVAACRKYLCRLDLSRFGTADGAAFADALDRSTNTLRAKLPQKAHHWGLARKALNIFLRDAFYTTYLNKAFRLWRAEDFFELPLDSITSIHLRRASEKGALSRWRGVKHLTRLVSGELQEAAKAEADKQGIARVHLDAYWWSVSRDNEAN
jgi:hypothetical protein